MYGTPKIELAEKEILQKVKISVGDLCSGFLVFLSLFSHYSWSLIFLLLQNFL